MSEAINRHINAFNDGEDLQVNDTADILDALINEQNTDLLLQLFLAWEKKGIAEDEIYGLARIMRERCQMISTRHTTFVDIVGTGGSRSKTFNISTAAAFVVSGAGVPVAKHGNRAATSRSGSADVLDCLGINSSAEPSFARRSLDIIGICFMFAPTFHKLSPTLAAVRRGLGFPTIFNCVGPLCNPANAPHQLIGVWKLEMLLPMANALARLGTKRSWIVHSSDGMDEISPNAPTFVAEINGGSVHTFEISPDDFGIEPRAIGSFTTKTPEASAAVVRGVLQGSDPGSTFENVVLINAAAAIYLAGRAGNLRDAFGYAIDGLRGGHALKKLEALATFR